jgi:hypothetical protein
MTLDEEVIAYFHQVGQAITAWATVEWALFAVLSACFDEGKHRNITGMGFMQIEGFRAKLLFTDGAVRRYLVGNPLAEEWLKTQSGMRNKMVHYQTQFFARNTEGRRVALCPWTAPKKRDRTKPTPGSLCTVDIAKARREFMAVRAQAQNFASRLCGQTEPFAKSDEQARPHPTMQQILRHIDSVLGHQQQSSREKRLEEDERNALASLLHPIEQIETPNGNDTKNEDPKV